MSHKNVYSGLWRQHTEESLPHDKLDQVCSVGRKPKGTAKVTSFLLLFFNHACTVVCMWVCVCAAIHVCVHVCVCTFVHACILCVYVRARAHAHTCTFTNSNSDVSFLSLSTTFLIWLFICGFWFVDFLFVCSGKIFMFQYCSLLHVYIIFIIVVCRARSVYERALDVDHRNITVWLKYAEMEMK